MKGTIALLGKVRSIVRIAYLAFALIFVFGGFSQSPPTSIPLSYRDARPLLQLVDEILPPELKGKTADTQAAVWPKWLSSLNGHIQARLKRGDEDTLVNFLLFGTTFTKRPRLSVEDLTYVTKNVKSGSASAFSMLKAETQELINGRVDDLVRALSIPVRDERLLLFRSLLPEKDLTAEKSKAYILNNLNRVMGESAAYAKALEAMKKGAAGEEFIARSTLFQKRGVSLDTTLSPNFALEVTFQEMKLRGLLQPGSVYRVAIVGPGLDFTDKDAGYDFYPPQTIQPFAVAESLSKLKLADLGSIHITTLDVSPRVNDHLARSRERALKGSPYTIILARDTQLPWKNDYLEYWNSFGTRIARPASSPAIPDNVTGINIRSLQVRPEVVLLIQPVVLNIVTAHLDLPRDRRFDLVVATNVFVYYDVLQQCLALANLEKMLKPGGFLLSNNALLELPVSKIRSVGYHTAVYSDRSTDGEHIVIYRLSQ